MRRPKLRSGSLRAITLSAAALAAVLGVVAVAAPLSRAHEQVHEEGAITTDQARAAFREANGLYADGRHEEAAALYEAILEGGFPNADVHYNLGNALYMTGDISGAVLNYERALRLDGDHEDALANLEFVREQLADRQVRVGGTISEALDRFFRRADADRVSVLTSLFYFVFIGCLTAAVLRRGFTAWLQRLTVVSLILLLVAGTILAYRVHRTNTVHEAVIVAADVPVRTGPGDDFVLEFRLHEGTKVRMRESREEWARVSVEGTDLEGWLPESTIEEI